MNELKSHSTANLLQVVPHQMTTIGRNFHVMSSGAVPQAHNLKSSVSTSPTQKIFRTSKLMRSNMQFITTLKIDKHQQAENRKLYQTLVEDDFKKLQ